MKKSILLLAIIGFTFQSYAQQTVLSKTQVKGSAVPTAIAKSISIDFPNSVIKEYTATPVHYVDQDVFISNFDDPDFMDSYQVILTSKGKDITANYNEDGKLLSAIEKLKDFDPPVVLRNAIDKDYPGWTIKEDTYRMTKNENGKKKERYGFILVKDGQKKHVYTDATGKIIK